MDIIIFKAGRMIGPLDRESVIGMLDRGEVSEHDLAQRNGVEVWIPLRRMFPPPAKPTPFDRAREIARGWALKFWTALHFDPLRVGVVSLLVGCLLIIFPRWTFLLFVPALVAAVFAGAILLTRHAGAAYGLPPGWARRGASAEPVSVVRRTEDRIGRPDEAGQTRQTDATTFASGSRPAGARAADADAAARAADLVKD
jgi:hypothetical protein